MKAPRSIPRGKRAAPTKERRTYGDGVLKSLLKGGGNLRLSGEAKADLHERINFFMRKLVAAMDLCRCSEKGTKTFKIRHLESACKTINVPPEIVKTSISLALRQHEKNRQKHRSKGPLTKESSGKKERKRLRGKKRRGAAKSDETIEEETILACDKSQ